MVGAYSDEQPNKHHNQYRWAVAHPRDYPQLACVLANVEVIFKRLPTYTKSLGQLVAPLVQPWVSPLVQGTQAHLEKVSGAIPRLLEEFGPHQARELSQDRGRRAILQLIFGEINPVIGEGLRAALLAPYFPYVADLTQLTNWRWRVVLPGITSLLATVLGVNWLPLGVFGIWSDLIG